MAMTHTEESNTARMECTTNGRGGERYCRGSGMQGRGRRKVMPEVLAGRYGFQCLSQKLPTSLRRLRPEVRARLRVSGQLRLGLRLGLRLSLKFSLITTGNTVTVLVD